jgi:hypothetical protein
MAGVVMRQNVQKMLGRIRLTNKRMVTPYLINSVYVPSATLKARVTFTQAGLAAPIFAMMVTQARVMLA